MREISKREKRLRQEENNDVMAEVEIINKETGKIVDRNTDFKDAALKWAKNKIWSRPYLKYKVYQMLKE